jgi:hypothetical protein
MRFNLSHDLALRSRLRDGEVTLPRAVIGALLRFDPALDSITTQLHASRDDRGSAWTVIARARDGLVVIRASTPHGVWTWRDGSRPEGATVTAHWYARSQVTSVELVDVALYTDRVVEEGEVEVNNGWVIHFSDGGSVRLEPRSNEDVNDRLAALALWLTGTEILPNSE